MYISKILLTALIVLLPWLQSKSHAQASADSLFTHIMAQSSPDSIKQNLNALKNLLKQHPDYAPALHQMAVLYIAQLTPQSRQNAKRALDQAIKLDPKNITYQITLGDLLWAQGFRLKANQQFAKIYNTSPDNAKAAYEIGHHAIKQYYHYQDMGRAFKHLVQTDLEKGFMQLKRSIELDPTFQDPYYLLGMVCFDQRRYGDLVNISNQLLENRPNDKDALLFKGLGLQNLANFEEANKAYQMALEQMDSAERNIMESVDWVTDKPEQHAFQKTDNIDWQNTPEHALFWQKDDPLFLTNFNERRLAHYGRIAYANLHFSRPSKGIAGWQTDMGKTYIRFGAPRSKRTIRPHAVVPTTGDGFLTVHTHREHWFYEGFKLTFQNWNGVDGWHFATVYVSALGGETPGTERLASDVFQKTPARYIDPYNNVKYSMPYQLARFKEDDSVRVELSYVLPRHKLLASAESGIVELEDGVFLFDNQWQLVYRDVNKVHLDLRKFQNHPTLDSLQKNHLLSMQNVKVKAGDYHVVAEARSHNTGTIGTVRQPHHLAFSQTELSASDLLLAQNIKPKIAFPESREDLRIVPNPMRTYYRQKPVFIYLEVYNLERNAFGQTRYEITYQLATPKQKDIDPTRFVAIDYATQQGTVEITQQESEVESTLQTESQDSDEPIYATEDDEELLTNIQTETQTLPEYQVKYVLPKSKLNEELAQLAKNGLDMTRSITAQYEGKKEDDFTFLQIDITHVPLGIHQLILTIKDLQTQQSVERKVLFRVL